MKRGNFIRTILAILGLGPALPKIVTKSSTELFPMMSYLSDPLDEHIKVHQNLKEKLKIYQQLSNEPLTVSPTWAMKNIFGWSDEQIAEYKKSR